LIHSKRGLIMAGLLVLVAGLIIMFPARVAFHWFSPPGLSAIGVQGTAWSGNANEAVFNGLYLSRIQWQLRPLRLLTGEVSYKIGAEPASGFFEANIGLGFGGNLEVTELRAALPLDLVAGAAGVPGLQGSASLTFDRLEFSGGMATAAVGTVEIANLIVPIVDRNDLGGYKAEFFTQDDGITASIEDTDGVVDIAGSLQINSDRSYAFIAQVIVKPETPQNVRKQLDFLPAANDRGQQELRLEGVL
jgi:hypothetical protein